MPTVTIGGNSSNDSNNVLDATMRDGTFNLTNYGAGNGIWARGGTVGSDNPRRTLLRFTLSDVIPAGSTVTGATLRLWSHGVSGNALQTVFVHELLRTDWDEGGGDDAGRLEEANWTNYKTSTAWAEAGGIGAADTTGDPGTTTGQLASFEVPAMSADHTAFTASASALTSVVNANISGAVNLMLSGGTNTTTQFVSRENADDGFRVQLDVTYVGPPRGGGGAGGVVYGHGYGY